MAKTLINKFFDILEVGITIKEAFIGFLKDCESEHPYAFSIGLAEDVDYLWAYGNTKEYFEKKYKEESISNDDSTYFEYKYFEEEWKTSELAEEAFKKLSTVLQEYISNNDDLLESRNMNKFRNMIIKYCVGCLKKLRKEKFFEQTCSERIFLSFYIPDFQDEKERIKILKKLDSKDEVKENYKWLF